MVAGFSGRGTCLTRWNYEHCHKATQRTWKGSPIKDGIHRGNGRSWSKRAIDQCQAQYEMGYQCKKNVLFKMNKKEIQRQHGQVKRSKLLGGGGKLQYGP